MEPPKHGGAEEIGRELTVADLKPKTVVAMSKDMENYATIWVIAITPRFVGFLAAGVEPAIELWLARTGEGLNELQDDSRRRVYIREYLGEV